MSVHLVPLTVPEVDQVLTLVFTSAEHRCAQADVELQAGIASAIHALRSPVGNPAYRRARAVLHLTLAGHDADRLLGRTTRS